MSKRVEKLSEEEKQAFREAHKNAIDMDFKDGEFVLKSGDPYLAQLLIDGMQRVGLNPEAMIRELDKIKKKEEDNFIELQELGII